MNFLTILMIPVLQFGLGKWEVPIIGGFVTIWTGMIMLMWKHAFSRGLTAGGNAPPNPVLPVVSPGGNGKKAGVDDALCTSRMETVSVHIESLKTGQTEIHMALKGVEESVSLLSGDVRKLDGKFAGVFRNIRRKKTSRVPK